MVVLAFLVAALVLFILSAASWPASRINLTAAGLACLTAAALVRFGL
jgi:hypothetical protein